MICTLEFERIRQSVGDSRTSVKPGKRRKLGHVSGHYEGLYP